MLVFRRSVYNFFNDLVNSNDRFTELGVLQVDKVRYKYVVRGPCAGTRRARRQPVHQILKHWTGAGRLD